MKPDPRIRAALEPAWSELREQRLLGRIAEARRGRAHGRRRRVVLAGALTLAGAAALAVVAVRRPAPPPVAARTPAAASRLTLADGSEALLTGEGSVQIEEQTPTRVRLRQRAGRARYVVAHDPARDFVVTAEGVTIRVRGTIFSVAVGAGAVEVSVERGRVEISDRFRTRDLVAGESLSVLARVGEAGSGEGEAPPAAASPVAETRPRPAPAPRQTGPSASELLARADAARVAGRADDAARALEAFVSAYPGERRAPAALFMLGRVESQRGRSARAASAFERCAAARPDGPLADDALAEAAQAWHAGGMPDRAQAAARASLAAHPAGLHAAAMRALAGR